MAFQIIHTFEKFIGRFDYLGEFKEVLEKCLMELLEMNIDGIVINVNTENGYLENDENWSAFIEGMKIAANLGFRIWIYDEKGYPSGGAGGLTLRDNPELEAKGIKFHNGKYFISNVYEGTHAERNFREKRRYINLLEEKAVGRFAEITYERYQKELPEDIFDKFEAFFTDEPSLMTVVLDVLDGSDGNKEIASLYPGRSIPVNDEPDPKVPIVPSIPYSDELNEFYFKSYGKKLLDISPEVFTYSEMPSETKCRFWEAVAKTYEENYGKSLALTCKRMNKKLTGHLLFEETPVCNVAFHANPMRILKHFQLPGIDLLSNVQENISVFAHKMVSSCAWSQGIKGIMTETSDFNEFRMGPRKPTGYKKIIAALYKQFALGVREFSFYYDFGIRMGKYGEIAGTIKNLCEYAKNIEFKPDCAVYCSYETIWAGFYPSMARPSGLNAAQPDFVRAFENSILKMCEDFYHNNIQFILMDESNIDEMIKRGIKQVVIPECTVVSKKLIEYWECGKIRVFGHIPEYWYSDGKLERSMSFDISDASDMAKPDIPVVFDKTPIITAFEGDCYFCFNPQEQDIFIMVCDKGRAYNPATDKHYDIAAGNSFMLAGESAVILEICR